MGEIDVTAEREKRDPHAWIGLDRGGTGIYEYVHGARGRFRIVEDGQTLEHCGDDQDGVWLYRGVPA